MTFCFVFSAIMMRVEDAIIKTLISVETPIATACKMFMPFKGNCFGKEISIMILHDVFTLLRSPAVP